MNALLVQRLLDALPQTQCTRCGFPDCAAYAQAIAADDAAINQCPPGGAEGIARLSAITGLPRLPLNPEHGLAAPRSVAFIDENWCIGCTLCIAACPTDAIIGTNKVMHTVQEVHCTGCELCLPVCPVDCIVLENASDTRTGWAAWSSVQAQQARDRYEFRSDRLKKDAHQRTAHPLKLPETPASAQGEGTIAMGEPQDVKQALIAAAIARARERLQAPHLARDLTAP